MTTTIELVGDYEIITSELEDSYFIDKFDNTHFLSQYVRVDSHWCNRLDLQRLGIDSIDTTSFSNYAIKVNKSGDGVHLFEIKEEL